MYISQFSRQYRAKPGNPGRCNDHSARKYIAGATPALEAPDTQLGDEMVYSPWRHGVQRKDGDIVFLTDNRILVENIKPTLTLVCAQKSATKKIVTEDDLVRSNIDGFGNDVGKVTNRITSMYDVQAQFEPGSMEYETLAYRIQCGQLYQQNAIDKTKGIVCKPMPKYWYDYRAIDKPENDSPEALTRYDLNRRIVADRKPYFMRYIYPVLKHDYNTYMKNVNMKALCEFLMTIDELNATNAETLTGEQIIFLDYYRRLMPVGTNSCTMNRICKRVEALCSDADLKPDHEFDVETLKSGVAYSKNTYYAVKKIYEAYRQKLNSMIVSSKKRTESTIVGADYRTLLAEQFRRDSVLKCNSQRELCDIVLDISYNNGVAKQFAWDVIGDAIIDNLLRKADGVIAFPVADPDGDIEYCGERYSMTEVAV